MRKKTYPHNIKNLVKLTIYLSLLITLQACGKEEGGGVSVSESTGNGSSDGSATLTWTAPTTNADLSPINGLTGYKVYYGTASGNYATPVDVGNVTTYTVTGLSSGTTYYFAVTAYNTNSNESVLSDEVSKTMQ